MLEIIALFFLTRNIGQLAQQKGVPPLKWKIFTILAWIAFEFVGVVFGVAIFGPNNIVSIMLVAIGFAITGYYLVRKYLDQLPDTDI
ncbi:MAG TPA: hypothetical protein PKY29_05905 [Ferruginibacter sp.]|nr:hypothetical protein [Ferruginibacter sp.]HRO17264.1 hypothetical protein [Ferruginibacter sp.]HRQ20830.1 hypothetical protein [Ferruginibacter sp.]